MKRKPGYLQATRRMTRLRSPARAAAFLAMTLLLATGAGAQTYPSRPVHIIVSFSAGGTIDALARILAQKLSERWGQSVIVDNRGGAAGNLGALAAAPAPADSSTLHLRHQP